MKDFLTVTEYARYKRMSRQGVWYLLKHNLIVGVEARPGASRFYIPWDAKILERKKGRPRKAGY